MLSARANATVTVDLTMVFSCLRTMDPNVSSGALFPGEIEGWVSEVNIVTQVRFFGTTKKILPAPEQDSDGTCALRTFMARAAHCYRVDRRGSRQGRNHRTAVSGHAPWSVGVSPYPFGNDGCLVLVDSFPADHTSRRPSVAEPAPRRGLSMRIASTL